MKKPEANVYVYMDDYPHKNLVAKFFDFCCDLFREYTSVEWFESHYQVDMKLKGIAYQRLNDPDEYSWEELQEHYLQPSLLFDENEFNRAMVFEYFPEYIFNTF